MMNMLHDSIVDRFRAGENAIAIGLSIGYSARRVRSILKSQKVGSLRRGRHGSSFQFETCPDGEYCLCRRCAHKGYGVDAWHPATTEFWRLTNGRLHFHQCKACLSERAENKRGFVRIAA